MKYPQVVSMPSAVSDWLEEQLEARGIDAVVYTRYILSLLHTHSIDVIYPDDDLPFSCLSKEVRRQSIGRGRKRSRGSSSFSCTSTSSSSDWWRHAHVDAERIKRSAAVECLMSLSEQNGEIEALVDELCEKLKQVKSSSTSPLILPSSTDTSFENISPQELAAKYYAAFPPLKKSQSSEQQPANWITVESKCKQESTFKTKKGIMKPHSLKSRGYESKLFSKVDCESAMKPARPSKQQFSILSRNKTFCSTKSEHFTNWSINMFKNNKKEEASDSKSPAVIVEGHDQCVPDVWSRDEQEINLYEDLPVDIQDLLDSPKPNNNTAETRHLSNMNNEGMMSSFIPYGANIIKSIWSNEEDTINDNDIKAAIESESSLDFRFSDININTEQHETSKNWLNFGEKSSNIETNTSFDRTVRRSLWTIDGFRSLPSDWKKPAAEAAEKKQLDEVMNSLSNSLIKLNHCKENSSFAEVIPRPQSSTCAQPFNPFGRSTSMFSFTRSGLYTDREKDDLLTSERTHFKPINEKLEIQTQKQYADGATFMISNNLEKVDYKRSESGTMWLETGLGQSKKYYEYKSEDSFDTTKDPPQKDFTLKFSICQNDKSTQTEVPGECLACKVEGSRAKKVSMNNKDDVYSSCDSYIEPKVEEIQCVCHAFSFDEDIFCPIHLPERPDSILGEMMWKYGTASCEKCGSNIANEDKINITKWNNGSDLFLIPHTELDNGNLNNLRNIWNRGELCQSCLKCNAANTNEASETPQSILKMQLRRDISQDGEQLLSDLTKFHMEELPLLVEMSCDISKLLSNATREGRRSFVVDDASSWNFASRLEEDCVIQMSTLPAIRSITF